MTDVIRALEDIKETQLQKTKRIKFKTNYTFSEGRESPVGADPKIQLAADWTSIRQ